MNDERKSSKAALAVCLVILLVVCPCLYVLSYGPYDWLCMSGVISPAMQAKLEVAYYPLGWMMLHSERLANFMLWYMNWFTDHFPPSLPQTMIESKEGNPNDTVETNPIDPFGSPPN
jgi:hypothetical protein